MGSCCSLFTGKKRKGVKSNGNKMEQNLELSASNNRYFKNPCYNAPQQLSLVVTEKWLLENIRSLMRRLSNRPSVLSPEESSDSGPYTGVEGIGFAFLQCAKLHPTLDRKNCIETCVNYLNMISSAQDHSRGRQARYLTGGIGLLTIEALCRYMLKKPMEEVEAKLRNLVEYFANAGYKSGIQDEIFNGRAGFLAAIYILRSETGRDIISDANISKVLEALIKSGRDQARRDKSSRTLKFYWHDKEYLGAAHGLSGILQILFCYWNLLDSSSKQDVVSAVDWLLATQAADGNFPSSAPRIGEGDYELVHWCHGAAGTIHLMIAAYIVLKDDKYLHAARKCTDLIWRKGILRKGPGICHGVSGNGYAFLLMYRLTSEEDYLVKAKAFAAVMMNPNFEMSARTPDSPLSLFEGWAGSLCFLVDLVDPKSAQFPLVPIPFNHEISSSSSSDNNFTRSESMQIL